MPQLWGVIAQVNPDKYGKDRALNVVEFHDEYEIIVVESNQYVLELFPIDIIDDMEGLAFSAADYLRYVEFWNQEVCL